MPTNVLRWIDLWMGVLLCALLTPVHYLRQWSGLCIHRSSTPKRILIIKLVELGAVIHAYPFLKKLRKDHPHAKIYILTFSKSKEIFQLLDEFLKIEETLTISEEGLMPMIKDLWRSLGSLLRIKADVCIDLEFFSRASAVLTFFSGASTTVGFYAYGFEGLFRGDFLTHKVSYNPLQHTAVNYLSLAAALDLPAKSSPEAGHFIETPSVFPVYRSQDTVRKSLAALEVPEHKRIFLMNAGEGIIPLREWPIENFKQVAQAILNDTNNALLFVGTAGARTKAEEVVKALNNERIKNYCGQTSLKQLMEIFLLAEALITNDGGLGHLAMLTPIKKFVFFGPETPQIFSPLGPNTHIFYSHWPCSPCLSALNHRNSSCRNNACLKAITAQHVIDTIKVNS